jgi:aspartyl-tRNA(Asn)/glutamyl-tRNA(Gln) amidotransferase subunit C
MAITREEVRHIALLARMHLTAEEESRLVDQLGAILEYVATLRRVDTSNVAPLAGALETDNTLRDDQVTNAPNTEALLANAPAADDGFFQVPKIIE